MSEPLKLGVVGCGRMFPAHLHGFRALRKPGCAAPRRRRGRSLSLLGGFAHGVVWETERARSEG